MAPVLTTGTVNCIQVGESFCFFQIRESSTGRNVAFVLFSFDDDDLSPSARIRQSMQVSLLREARASNIPIHISHDSASGKPNFVQLGLLA